MELPALRKKSDEKWELSEQLRQSGSYNAAANRLYYSVFQAVKAYAVKSGKMKPDEKVSVHGSANRIVRADNKNHYAFCEAMEMRERGDYQDDSVSESEFSQKFLCEADSLRQYYRQLAIA